MGLRVWGVGLRVGVEGVGCVDLVEARPGLLELLHVALGLPHLLRPAWCTRHVGGSGLEVIATLRTRV